MMPLFTLPLAVSIACTRGATVLNKVPSTSRSSPANARMMLGLFGPNAKGMEDQLLADVVSGKATNRDALAGFNALEQTSPSPDDLLLDPSKAAMIDGRWKLLSTIAAVVGDDEAALAASGVSNAVNASGLVIDASAARAPIQEVDVAAQRIGNEIKFSVPLGGGDLVVRVAGDFATSATDGRRALVEFDTLDLFSSGEGQPTRRLLRAGWLFDLVRKLKPALANGADSQSWLDTTYISTRCRLGRGNKGSVFILERDEAAEGPLAAFPL